MIEIDAALVKQLIRTQFPQWAELHIAPVENGGLDRVFRLGDSMPRRPGGVDTEHEFFVVPEPKRSERC